jgi:hypothetical protein
VYVKSSYWTLSGLLTAAFIACREEPEETTGWIDVSNTQLYTGWIDLSNTRLYTGWIDVSNTQLYTGWIDLSNTRLYTG